MPGSFWAGSDLGQTPSSPPPNPSSTTPQVQPYRDGVSTSRFRLDANTSAATTPTTPIVMAPIVDQTGIARPRPRPNAKPTPTATGGAIPASPMARATRDGRDARRVRRRVSTAAATAPTTITVTATTIAPSSNVAVSKSEPGAGSASRATPIGKSG